LAFAEHIVTNSPRLWTELDLAQRQRLQSVLSPKRLRFDGERFGTAVTCLAFKRLDGTGESNSGMASPPRNAPNGNPVSQANQGRVRAA
jgi:hypothetical protein